MYNTMAKIEALGQFAEQKPIKKQFEWKNYVRNLGNISERNRVVLDDLENMINQGGQDTQEFLEGLNNGEFRNPALSLVQFFRDVLNSAERAELLDEIRKAGASPGTEI